MMIKNTNNLRGWLKKTEKEVYYQKCPYCGKLKDGLTVINEKEVKCPKCSKNYPFKENTVKLKKNALICFCGEEVPLIDSNKTYLGEYMCPNCRNILAIKYKEDIIIPPIILSPKWLENEFVNAQHVCNQLYAIDCDYEKSSIAFKIIHDKVVLPQGHSFTCFKPSTQKGILFFDKKNMEYVGCIIWSEDKKNEMNVLRQIFVFKNKRMQGYGTQMMEYWINNYGLNKYPFFGVETPNKHTYHILLKLGYVKEENGKFKNIKWHLIYNG